MRIIFSRKGFDSASGGGPSPIVQGRPLSLPIPSSGHSATSYADLGLGQYAEIASRGRVRASDPCHHDPMFLDDGTCLFGQCGAAQTHLRNQGVREGDVFVFFGLFRDEGKGAPHHRIFGYLEVDRIIDLATCSSAEREAFAAHKHPHALGMYARNDTIYCGKGRAAQNASPELCLTAPGGPPSLWQRPDWLRPGELSYHDRADRWRDANQLQSVARGQEFVAPIGRRQEPRKWLEKVIHRIIAQPSRK